jgi:polyvinyl alcohol dehydrogenase (cytochrome)
VLWRTFTLPEAQVAGKSPAGVTLWGPSGVGIWSAPTIDVKRASSTRAPQHVQRAEQPTADAIVAFDLKTGAIKWIRQLTADDVFGCRAGTANCSARSGPDADLGTPADAHDAAQTAAISSSSGRNRG